MRENQKPKIFLSDGFMITPQAEESILESLERCGISCNYQCRAGFCGVCRQKIKGRVKYFLEPLGYKRDNEVLICCSRLENQNIYLEDKTYANNYIKN